MSEIKISEKGRQERFAQWEKIGLDRIKHDLLNGGYRVVGGPLQEQELAWEWVRMKEAEQKAAITVSPEAARALGLSPPATAAETLKALGITSATTVGEHLQSVVNRINSPGGQGMPPPMSIERRRHILAATSILKSLGHSGFDRMLLELGVPEDVGTGSGLAARANSLARYILSNPDAKAIDGTLIGDAVVSRARSLAKRGVAATSSNVSDQEKSEYKDASANDIGEDSEGDQTLGEQPTAGTAFYQISTKQGGPDTINVRKKPRRKVFIVHGHDIGPRESVARFLERLSFEPVILHERPNRGRTIITKFQQEAADVGFAVVLMTPDDTGGSQATAESLRPRARQNVIFELGFFIGVLGPERVAALMKGDVEKPSDFDGVVYISLDDLGAWKQSLGRELEAAGFEIDWKKATGP